MMIVDILRIIKQRLQSKVTEGNLLWRLLVFPGRFSRYKLKLILAYFELYSLRKSLKSKLSGKKLKNNEVTIIITSAGRKEYLQKTIESLRKYFQYDDKKTKWFIIDDYPESQETRSYIENLKGFDLKLLNTKNRGLGYSLNRIYSEVESEFVFHCEDDWEFLRPIPIMKMMTLLRQDSTLGQILAYREPINQREYVGAKEKDKGYAEYNRIFAFNPYLTKMELFLRFYPFALYFTAYEYALKVRKGGYKSGIIGYHEAPYVRHLGAHRRARIK
ncbi:MAG: glycosyltransferase family 2 protein [Patescibacteria group bacterium]|nr:glycosyltransferase family 2 protein [Patescibacteria group bacterium]